MAGCHDGSALGRYLSGPSPFPKYSLRRLEPGLCWVDRTTSQSGLSFQCSPGSWAPRRVLGSPATFCAQRMSILSLNGQVKWERWEEVGMGRPQSSLLQPHDSGFSV